MTPVNIWEDPVVFGKSCWPVEVALIICVRLIPNDSGLWKEVAEVVEIAVTELERVPLGFESTKAAQDVGLLVIRMTPEPA